MTAAYAHETCEDMTFVASSANSVVQPHFEHQRPTDSEERTVAIEYLNAANESSVGALSMEG